MRSCCGACALLALAAPSPGGDPAPPRAPILVPTGQQSGPGGGSSLWTTESGLLVREGAFLRNRRGRMVRAEGEWVYIFDKDAEGKSEPPMVMLPCRRLREMQQTLERREGTQTFQVSGQVFAYDGRNYLLPEFFSVVSIEESAAPERTREPAAATAADPAAADLLKDMTRATPRAASGSRAAGGIADTGAERTAELREGVMIVSRRGRVVRDGGHLVFVTDNDPAGRPLPPMPLQPCLNLEALDRLVRQRGAGSSFIMSGRVFAHEGRNYLLPTFFQVDRDREGNLVSGQ